MLSPSQIPPRPISAATGLPEPSVPGEKAVTPAGSEVADAPPTRDGTSQGSWPSTPTATSHQVRRARAAPPVSIVARASSPPVGVSAATADHSATAANEVRSPVRRNRAAASRIHGIEA